MVQFFLQMVEKWGQTE